ncbi:MAG: ATP-binding protein [Candidatus Deferrimicrobiaceae bacterium]
MRSLFFRIFVSFLGATVLIGVLLLALALTTDPQRIVFAPHEERLARIGKAMLDAYRTGGSTALQEIERLRERKGELPAILFRNSEGTLSGREAPPLMRQLAAKAAVTGERQVQKEPHGPPLIGMPLGDGYVLVAVVLPPSPVEMFLNPYGLTLRLGAVFLVTGLISYFLARSLSAPLRTLRDATQQLASGDLSVRVGPSLEASRDETAELGRDIDRMAERIGDLLASQRRLLRDISHELRSPLARLNVALGLARRKAGADAQGSLDRIEREAERLNDLIGELLTLAQLERDTRGIERIPVDLQILVGKIVEDADFEANVVNRRVRVVQNEPVTVTGVPELLRRAIENVVRNGVRFTSEDSAVEVRLSRSEGISGSVARISVRDHGPGVPEESLAKLFEPFYRVTDARDRQSGGTGIGLAITQRAIKLHGGTVRAFNTPGGGMDVVLELPC